MKELLPVVIASYERFNLLKQTIESIQTNSYHDIQIIVVDNSNSPRVIKYLESLPDITLYRWGKIKKYPHLRVESPRSFNYPYTQQTSPYWTEEWSLGKSRTMGAILAPPSKYIYFSDNDMYLLKDWDKILIDTLKKYREIVLVGGSGQHTPWKFYPVNKSYQVGLASLQVGNTMMFRRDEWARIGFFPDYDEDTWISREMSDRFDKSLGVIVPSVAIHCGATSTYTKGVPNRTKDWTPTHPNAKIELNRETYPDLVFE